MGNFTKIISNSNGSKLLKDYTPTKINDDLLKFGICRYDVYHLPTSLSNPTLGDFGKNSNYLLDISIDEVIIISNELIDSWVRTNGSIVKFMEKNRSSLSFMLPKNIKMDHLIRTIRLCKIESIIK